MVGRVRGRYGFSTIETILVIVVIGALIAIALPRIDRVRYQMESGAQTVATAMLAAQRSALTLEHDVVVSFDSVNRRIVVLYDANNDGQVDASERTRTYQLEPVIRFNRGGAPPRPMGGSAINLSRTIGGLPSVVFHRSGSASSAGGLYVTSARAAADTANRADTRALEVIRATGRTEWWRFDGNNWKRGF